MAASEPASSAELTARMRSLLERVDRLESMEAIRTLRALNGRACILRDHETA